MMLVDEDERLLVSEQMRTNGGSFVKCIGNALLHSDMTNTSRIKETWPEYWETYRKMGAE